MQENKEAALVASLLHRPLATDEVAESLLLGVLCRFRCRRRLLLWCILRPPALVLEPRARSLRLVVALALRPRLPRRPIDATLDDLHAARIKMKWSASCGLRPDG